MIKKYFKLLFLLFILINNNIYCQEKLESVIPIRAKDEDGNTLTANDIQGNALIYFTSGNWCPPCIKGIKVLNRLHADNEHANIYIIVDSHRDLKDYHSVKELSDIKNVYHQNIFNHLETVPVTFIIDEGQFITKKIDGVSPEYSDILQNYVSTISKAGDNNLLKKIKNIVVLKSIINGQKNPTYKYEKKINAFFKKNKIDKAEKFSFKKNKDGVLPVIALSMAENYFLLATKNFRNKNYKASIENFKKAKKYYYNSLPTVEFNQFLNHIQRDYNIKDALQTIKRYLGMSNMELAKKTNDKEERDHLIKKAYDYFSNSINHDLIESYNKYFSIVYLEKFEEDNNNAYLKKAFESCNTLDDISAFDNTCKKVASYYVNDIFKKTNDITDAEKAEVLYKKLNETELLNQTYETIAISIIHHSSHPKDAMKYIDKISNADDKIKEKYRKLINQQLIKNCKDFYDCIQVYNENPNLKNDIFEKTLSLAKTIDDYILSNKKFPEKKEVIANQMLNNIQTFDDIKKALEYFPSKTEEIKAKIFTLPLTLEDLKYVYENFPDLQMQAEQKAVEKVSSIEDKKEFIEYFPKSSYTTEYKTDISKHEAWKKLQQKLDSKQDEIEEKIGELISNAYHKYPKGLYTHSHLTVDDDVATIEFNIKWYVLSTLRDRTIDYSVKFPATMNLKEKKISIGWPEITFDGESYRHNRFNEVKPQIKKLLKTLMNYIIKTQKEQ